MHTWASTSQHGWMMKSSHSQCAIPRVNVNSDLLVLSLLWESMSIWTCSDSLSLLFLFTLAVSLAVSGSGLSAVSLCFSV